MTEYGLLYITTTDADYDTRIMLEKQTSGIHKGYLNGYGGTFNPEKDKNVINTIIRKTYQTTGIKVDKKEMMHIAQINFLDEDETNPYSKLQVYITPFHRTNLDNIIHQKRLWHNVKTLPYHRLPETDIYWIRDAFQFSYINVNITMKKPNYTSVKSIEFTETID